MNLGACLVLKRRIRLQREIPTQAGIGAVATHLCVGSRDERYVGIKHLADFFLYHSSHIVAEASYIFDGNLVETQGGVVVFARGILDKEQGRTDRNSLRIEQYRIAHDV